jgi:hypothetical protein
VSHILDKVDREAVLEGCGQEPRRPSAPARGERPNPDNCNQVRDDWLEFAFG